MPNCLAPTLLVCISKENEIIAYDTIAIANKLAILKFLISRMKADVTSSVDDLGRTALVMACSNSPNVRIIRLLFESGDKKQQ